MRTPGPGEKPTIKKQLQLMKSIARKEGRDVLPSLSLPKKKTSGPRGKYNREEDRLRPLIIKALRKKGYLVYRVETAINHQLGIPDLWVMHWAGKWAGWLEVKTPTGVLSDEQKAFMKYCDVNKVNCFVIRSVEEVNNF
jgi:hypothetical protein